MHSNFALDSSSSRDKDKNNKQTEQGKEFGLFVSFSL